MGTHSDDESQSRKKLKSSESNANAGKQESCIQFSKGRCRYGGKCRYAHDIANQKRTNRMKLCEFFNSGRRACRYGDKCRYIHNSGGGLGMSRQSSTNTRRIKPNPYDYDAKSEILSNEPRPTSAIHIKPNRYDNPQNAARVKTKLCARWEKKGTCDYGSNCTFAHGNEDLRRVDLDSSSGYALDTASENAEPSMPESGIDDLD